jgi:hypothetical protein
MSTGFKMCRVVFLLGWAGVLSAAAQEQAVRPAYGDLAHNGGFEQGLAYWQFLVNNGAKASGQLDATEKHQGKNSFKLTNASGRAPNVYARITQTITGLRPFTTYTVSCWAKGKGCGVNWIGGGPGWLLRTAMPTGDFDWRQVSFEVNTGDDADNYDLMMLTESSTVALWIDDVRFDVEKIDQARQQAAYAQMNATVAGLEQRLKQLPEAGGNAYIGLGRAVAERFIQLARSGPNSPMSFGWTKLQLEEVGQVLDETEKIARAGSPLLDWTQPKPGVVKMENGTFYNDGRPFCFYGYGHFNSVIDDLSNFPAMGVSLIQDGRSGPSSMEADGRLGESALAVLQGLDTAARYGVRDDILLSPHYYPAWGQAPDVPNNNIGFINFNIFHPKAREAICRWAATLADHIKDKPALHSVCLANEPVYNSSGRDAYSRPMYIDYLKQKHLSIETVNALYGTHYTNFDGVAVPACAMPEDAGGKRAYYDWCCFNEKMFADWHGWMDSIVKSHGVKAPTHTKIMVFYTMDRERVGWGVDPELICQATDLAGCDAYAFLGGNYAYDWFGHEFFYDLLHSFRGQSVFNSENHLIPDGYPRTHVPMNHTRSVLWQDGLHHEGSTTIWVWQMGSDNGLGGSIYFRPANIFGAGRAMLDLNRLGPEVAAINQAPPRVVLLNSKASIFWEEKYKPTISSVYTALNFMGEPITFVSERQLASGKLPQADWVIVPNATHILDTTGAALDAFTKQGGKVLLVGQGCLGHDEYDHARVYNPGAYTVIEPAADDQALSALLRTTLKLPHTTDLRQSPNGLPAWGVEFRTVPFGQATLMPMVNLNHDVRKVTLPAWEGCQAVDLLTGEVIDAKLITLDSMAPRLVRFEPKDSINNHAR